MINYFLSKKGKIILALLLGFGVLLLLFTLTPKANAASEIERLNNLQLQVTKLSSQLSSFAPIQAKNISTNTPIRVAQSARNLASINVRLNQLEEQIRILTGQVEGLQFQMTQMQTFLERQQEDYEFRFEQLEGGGLGKIKAAPSSDSALAVNEVSPKENNINLTPPNSTNETQAIGLEHSIAGQPLGALPNEQINLSSQALDLSVATVDIVTSADANAQYSAGYDAVKRGDYSFAEEQFRQFIALFPTHPQAPDATNWLGEALILRGEYQEAADILLSGFQSYSGSKKAPDLLLKLGQALAGAGEHATACRTFEEVTRRYPDISSDLTVQLSNAISKAKC